MNRFDRFAERAESFVAQAPFFVACVAVVLLWAPSIVFIKNVDTWQLIINTLTTIFTFLMVALLQNAQRRFENATHGKLNAIAHALAEFAERDLKDDEIADELRHAVGLESETSA